MIWVISTMPWLSGANPRCGNTRSDDHRAPGVTGPEIDRTYYDSEVEISTLSVRK